MKRFQNIALLSALMCISLAAGGCGSSSGTSGTGGVAGVGGVSTSAGVISTPGGGGQVTFSGVNIYYSGVTAFGMTQGVNPASLPYIQQAGGVPQYLSYSGGGYLSIGSTSIPSGAGTSTMSGSSVSFPGSTISVTLTQASSYSYGGASLAGNIVGSVNLSPQFVMTDWNGTIPSIQGIAIDLGIGNSSIYNGGVWLCTTVNCAPGSGAFLPIGF